ncbi:MAG: hypothetical protein AB7O37_20610 [Vicinamibacteria bacterium]
MPVSIIRPSASGSLGDAWSLGAGGSKAAAVDPGDPVSHDDGSTYIAVGAAPGGANLQSFYMNTGVPLMVDVLNVDFFVRGGMASAGVEALSGQLFRAGTGGVSPSSTAAYYSTFSSLAYARPGGGAWVKDDFAVNNIQARVSVPTDSALAARVTSIWVELTHTVPAAGLIALVFEVLGPLAAVGLAEIPRLCRELATRRGVRLAPRERLTLWRELRAYSAPRYYFRPAAGAF